MVKSTRKQIVLLALSGGVDSAVAALLLKEQGYEVMAAFMKIWSDTKTVQGTCAWKEERRDALRVAAKLAIPFVTLDFEREYRESVATYLFREYGAGRTPNPDVLCNSEIKFPLLRREAQRLGADLIATGHHVRKGSRVKGKGSRVGKWELLVGKDTNKDQSYFLHQLTQEDLEHTLFPIGEYSKEEVRTIARRHNLPVADKRSTRGICFVGKVSLPDFLAQAMEGAPGPIRTTAGAVVGTHGGIAPYTIGQRHGFGVGGGDPLYVIEKDVATKTLVVGDESDAKLHRFEIRVSDLHWISGETPSFPFRCHARIRYRSPLVPVTINPKRYTLSAIFDTPLRAPAPGQFVVFYEGDVCLGGGVIV